MPILCSSTIKHITLCQLFKKTDPMNKGNERMGEVGVEDEDKNCREWWDD
jgi:hypothetical protein